MPEFEATTFIKASRSEIADYICDVSNLHAYLPSLHDARKEGDEQVRLKGSLPGAGKLDSTGWVRVEGDCLRWGDTGGLGYGGWMEINEAEGGCSVRVHLRVDPRGKQSSFEGQAQQTLDEALGRIKEALEGAQVPEGRAKLI